MAHKDSDTLPQLPQESPFANAHLMLLKSLEISKLGPFFRAAKVEFEDEVTVLTGGNDCGKSSVLNAIELIYNLSHKERHLQESDVNLDHFGQTKTEWQRDPEIACAAVFRLTELSKSHVNNPSAAEELLVQCRLAPEVRDFSQVKFRKSFGTGNWSTGGSVAVREFPRVIRVPTRESVRATVDLKSPNRAEAQFLRALFGPSYGFEKYNDMTPNMFALHLSKAKGDANAKLCKMLPASMAYEFDFQVVGGDKSKISIQLRDSHEGHTSLDQRGSGIQRLVSLMGQLLSSDLSDNHYIILADEPEASLHADAQHALRSALESLAEKPSVQVVYATHSPSMINPFRTHSVRLLKRSVDGGLVTSSVDNRPIDGNFLAIRSSLGVNASDSLLYGPVTLIVEGPSEVIGLPIILDRLAKAGVEGFEDVKKLFSLIHFLDGSGDSFDKLCKLALSQGTKPVVFLDGDKTEARLAKLRRECPEVPIVQLEKDREFEEIVPRSTYIESLATVMEQFVTESRVLFTESKFLEWKSTQNFQHKIAFSKQFDRWVEATANTSIEKPLVMKHALTTVVLTEVEQSVLKQLLAAVKSQLTD